jgi:hypothetical protein
MRRFNQMFDLSSNNVLGSLIAVLALVGATPASAQALFTGFGKQSGAIFGPTLYTTISAPTNTASVTASGDFTIPAKAFARATSYTFTLLPVYPYVFIKITQSNHAGAFGDSYFTPSVPVTATATNAQVPRRGQTPRVGFMRLVPGSKGFGGQMPMDLTRTYDFLLATSLGTLQAFATTIHQSFGGAPLGFWDPIGKTPGGLCCISYPTTSPAAYFTAKGGTFVGPWITGMATVYNPHGAAITTTSKTGVDARSAFDTGVISLVTPKNSYVYQGDGGGTVTFLRDGFAYIQAVEITFMPEPGQMALLTSGFLGLLALSRLRRRRA